MDRDIRDKAAKKVRSIRRLYIHMSVFAIMAVFFFLLNIATDPYFMWYFFPLIPWGAIVALHYVLVKGIPGTRILTKEWEEEEYEKQLDRLGGDRYSYIEEEEDFIPQKGKYLAYTELSDEEALELRRLQKHSAQNLGTDFV